MAAEPTAIAANTRQAKANARIRYFPNLIFVARPAIQEPPAADKNACSGGKRKSLRLDIDEGSSEQTDESIEIGDFARFEIYEETPDPWGEVFLEEGTISVPWCGNIAADQPC